MGAGALLGFLVDLVFLVKYPLFFGAAPELLLGPFVLGMAGVGAGLGAVAGRAVRGKLRPAEDEDDTPDALPASNRFGRGLGLVLLLAAFACLGLFAWRADARHWTVAPKVLIFGVDGAGWNVLGPLMERGEVPTFAGLVEGGASGTLKSFEPTYSPIIWTSIGSGVKDHGIVSFHSQQAHLRAKRFWEVLAEGGTRVGIFRWWMTSPPRELDGFIVPGIDDQVGTAHPDAFGFGNRLRLHMKSGREMTAGDAWDYVSRYLDCGLTFETSLAVFDELVRAKLSGDSARTHLAQRRIETWLNATIYQALLRRTEPELTAFYDNGVDVVSHFYWKFHEPEVFPDVTPEEVERYGSYVEDAYRFTDAAMAEILAHVDTEETTVLVVSDHGLQAGPPLGTRLRILPDRLLQDLDLAGDFHSITVGAVSFLHSNRTDPAEARDEILRLIDVLEDVTIAGTGEPALSMFPHPGRLEVNLDEEADIDEDSVLAVGGREIPVLDWATSRPGRSGGHSLDGIVIAAGPGIRHGTLAGAGVLDVAPTVLWLMEFPLSEELEGAVLSSALDPALWTARPPETVPSYGHYDAETGDIEIDPAYLQKLQDMGYVGREGPGD